MESITPQMEYSAAEITDYHAKYFAHELTRRFPTDSTEKLAGAVASAQVDLNPHQVDAALFAFNSPLSKGALLADEVGLGKTIEAGLVLSQKWAERKRCILVITPSNLRKQWHQELTEKFFLPCRILESKSYNAAIRQGQFRPFESSEIIICSYQFAKSKAADVHAMPWDLVVIDEAHRLRNVYKPSNVIANTLKMALAGKHKLLLTATPLQNSLLELFGLVSFIDEHTFGDLKSFREQFANLNQEQVFQTLKARLKPVCHRTLRRQVTAYIPYTKRLPLVEEFTPEESEDRLYNLVSEYLQRDNLQALPASQRSLMTLVLRKLLASSTFAIAGALTSISNRLKLKLRMQVPAESLEDELDQDYEALDETAEEWADDEPVELLTEDDRKALEQEISELDAFAALATSIDHNAKGKALLKALGVAFAKAKELGGAEKAIIFTESCRTQSYLLRLLADSSFAEGIVLFNGTNTDDRSKLIYSQWAERHQGTDRISGSRTADMRSALVDYFREEGRIMIATEAGAEGKGGISEAVNWQGGGGFRFYKLAPSLLRQDAYGQWVINKEYNAEMLAQALCKLEGFTYAPSDAHYWMHGHSTERDFIYVTTANLNHEQLQQLSDEVGAERSLLVLCTAFRGRGDYPNLTVKKIPKQVLSRCEWGHDDYSLQVENLPKAPPSPPAPLPQAGEGIKTKLANAAQGGLFEEGEA